MAFEQPTRSRPAERYGDLRPAWHSTLARVLVVALAVLVLAFTALAGWQAANRDVRWTDVGYVILDDGRARTTFDVTVYQGTTAICTVQALAADYSVVGRQEVRIDVGTGRSVRERVEILTTSRAVTAVVEHCRVP